MNQQSQINNSMELPEDNKLLDKNEETTSSSVVVSANDTIVDSIDNVSKEQIVETESTIKRQENILVKEGQDHRSAMEQEQNTGFVNHSSNLAVINNMSLDVAVKADSNNSAGVGAIVSANGTAVHNNLGEPETGSGEVKSVMTSNASIQDDCAMDVCVSNGNSIPEFDKRDCQVGNIINEVAIINRSHDEIKETSCVSLEDLSVNEKSQASQTGSIETKSTTALHETIQDDCAMGVCVSVGNSTPEVDKSDCQAENIVKNIATTDRSSDEIKETSCISLEDLSANEKSQASQTGSIETKSTTALHETIQDDCAMDVCVSIGNSTPEVDKSDCQAETKVKNIATTDRCSDEIEEICISSQGLNANQCSNPVSDSYRVVPYSESEDSDSSSSSSSVESSDESSECEEDMMESNGIKRVPSFNKISRKMKVSGEMSIEDLPPIEDLQISVTNDQASEIGKVLHIVDTLVIVESYKDQPPLDIESVLFLEKGARPLGRIFDVIGLVTEPLYCVRFNSKEHIEKSNVQPGMLVYSAPQTQHSHFVFLKHLMMMKGSDASWRKNREIPSNLIDYSDDEEEAKYKPENHSGEPKVKVARTEGSCGSGSRSRGRGRRLQNPWSWSGSRYNNATNPSRRHPVNPQNRIVGSGPVGRSSFQADYSMTQQSHGPVSRHPNSQCFTSGPSYFPPNYNQPRHPRSQLLSSGPRHFPPRSSGFGQHQFPRTPQFGRTSNPRTFGQLPPNNNFGNSSQCPPAWGQPPHGNEYHNSHPSQPPSGWGQPCPRGNAYQSSQPSQSPSGWGQPPSLSQGNEYQNSNSFNSFDQNEYLRYQALQSGIARLVDAYNRETPTPPSVFPTNFSVPPPPPTPPPPAHPYAPHHGPFHRFP